MTTTNQIEKVTFEKVDPKYTSESITKLLKDVSANPDMLLKFRRFLKQFTHNYSFYNRLLIYLQTDGEATQVMGFGSWKKLGRWIIKGEKSIKLLAPIIKKQEKEKTDGSSETVYVPVAFKTVSVFDISQTQGADFELPTLGELKVDEPENLLALMKSKITEHGIAVVEKQLEFRKAGYTTGEYIVLNSLTTASTKILTLFHELAHVELGHMKDRVEVPHNLKEIEAELVAFLTSNKFGVPQGSYDYIEGHLKDKQLTVETIQKAVSVADRIEKLLLPHTPHN